MKCAVVLTDGVKQVMLCPETDNERMALEMIGPNDDISVEKKRGSFTDSVDTRVGYSVDMCQGGYLRAFSNSDCLMLVVRQRDKEEAGRK